MIGCKYLAQPHVLYMHTLSLTLKLWFINPNNWFSQDQSKQIVLACYNTPSLYPFISQNAACCHFHIGKACSSVLENGFPSIRDETHTVTWKNFLNSQCGPLNSTAAQHGIKWQEKFCKKPQLLITINSLFIRQNEKLPHGWHLTKSHTIDWWIFNTNSVEKRVLML